MRRVMTTRSPLAVPTLSRTWIWVQLAIGWLPLWAVLTVLIATVHGESVAAAAPAASRLVFGAALLGLLVHRFVLRNPWPHPMRLIFVAKHLAAMTLYASGCMLSYSVIESLFRQQLVFVVGPGVIPFFVTGAWFYVMVAAVAYANQAAARASQLTALEARAQLAVLRGQMHPHFLFNALHTVVQLIPVDPRGAGRAAELLADVLRAALSEPRDTVTLAEEWEFVQRYLEIERIRFGERLRVRTAFDAAALACRLPSFALQTLVENAVRHAAAPRIEPVTLSIAARVEGDVLVVIVSDDGPGADVASITQSSGTGLRRLREQLKWLHGSETALTLASEPGAGLTATLSIPQRVPDQADDDE
jgi:hypothetical protein